MKKDNIQDQIKKNEFYKKLEDFSKQPSFTIVGSALLILFLLAFVIRPSITVIKELKTKIETFEETNTDLKNKLINLSKLEEIYRSIENKNYLVEKAIPDDPSFEDFEKIVRFYIQKNGMQISSLNLSSFYIVEGEIGQEEDNKKPEPEPAKKETDSEALNSFKALDFNIEVTGNYLSAKKLVDNLQKNIRFFSIDSVSLESISSKDSEVLLKIKGKIYYFKFIGV